MIDFEPADSEYYDYNKNFCDRISHVLDSLNADFSGFCNSYGYEIKSRLEYKGLNFKLDISKSQTSVSTGWYPRDSINSIEIQIVADTFPELMGLTVTKSSFFSKWKSGIKKRLKNDYIAILKESQSTLFIDSLNATVSEFDVKKIIVKNGTLRLRMKNEELNLMQLIHRIIEIKNKWV